MPSRLAVLPSAALLVVIVRCCSMLLALLLIVALRMPVCSVVCALLRLLLCTVAHQLLRWHRLLLRLPLLCRALRLCEHAIRRRWLWLLLRVP